LKKIKEEVGRQLQLQRVGSEELINDDSDEDN
jgi:hypothetical protein